MLRLAATILASMLLPASASGEHVGSLSSSAKCFWHVTEQTLIVESPVIYDVDVGTSCPRPDWGVIHDDICTECDGLDNQCGGEFVACAGCCQLPKEARYHQCENIKKYFFERNSKSVACDARMDLSDGDVNVELGEETTQRESSGNLISTCEAPVIKAAAEGVPLKLQFDCTACALQGVPDLLRQCCDKAEEFKDSIMIRKKEAEGFTVFLWADGCHDQFIGRDASIEWTDTYPTLTEAAIDGRMDKFIDDQYCSKTRKSSPDSCSRRLLRYEESNYWSPEANEHVLESNLSRRLNGGDDCPWLSPQYTHAGSGAPAQAGFEGSSSAAGLSLPLTAMLIGGGIACFAP